MPTVHRSIIVPYAAWQMYDLVNHIELYEHFIPWCESSVVHNRSHEIVRASLCLAKGGIRKSFTTENTMVPNQEINLALVDGPFKQLVGRWHFVPLAEHACKVVLDMEFEFTNKVLAYAFGPLFSQVANKLVDIFAKRAKTIYGEPYALSH